MEKNAWKDTDGEKIRWQYFTAPIVTVACVAVFMPYADLILSLFSGNFDLSKWFSVILTAIFAWFEIPLIVLAIFNRRCFGTVVCVMNKSGIYHEGGFISWDDVLRIEYTIDFSRRNHLRYCHANVYTEKGITFLNHVPLFILSHAKKYKPRIDVGITKISMLRLALLLLAYFAVIPIIAAIKSKG